MKLPKSTQNKTYEIGQLFKVLLQLHKDSYIDTKDIEVEYFDSWDFYKVSVFRWSQCSHGCGTKDFRDGLWEKRKKDILELFDMKTEPNVSWRWKHDYCYTGQEIETEENGSIPGMTFFIQCE
jgi:hypothetical protein